MHPRTQNSYDLKILHLVLKKFIFKRKLPCHLYIIVSFHNKRELVKIAIKIFSFFINRDLPHIIAIRSFVRGKQLFFGKCVKFYIIVT